MERDDSHDTHECESCDGYGHIRAGRGSADRNDRRCMDCGGTGQHAGPLLSCSCSRGRRARRSPTTTPDPGRSTP